MKEKRRLLEVLGDGVFAENHVEDGRVVMEFSALQDFCQSGGVVQGGFVSGWIDSAMAHAAMARDDERVVSTLELKVSFLRGVLPDQRVRAHGWIEKMGRQVAFLAGRLEGEDGRVLATATSTALLLPRPKAVETETFEATKSSP